MVYYRYRWEVHNSKGDMAAGVHSGKLREYVLNHRCERVNWKGEAYNLSKHDMLLPASLYLLKVP